MLFFVVVAECMTLYVAFDHFGFFRTVLTLLASAALGIFILQAQGFQALRDLQRGPQLQASVSTQLANRLAKMAAGVLFIVPGFLSDFMAILLLFPLTRRFLLRASFAWLATMQRNGRIVVMTPQSSSPTIRDVTPTKPEQLGGPTNSEEN